MQSPVRTSFMKALKIGGVVMGAILVALIAFGSHRKSKLEAECAIYNKNEKEAIAAMEFSNPSFEDGAFRVRMHNKSPHDIYRDYVFYVYVDDCLGTDCTPVGSGTYYVRGDRSNVIFSGEAEDVTAHPILGSGIPDVRPQGVLRYTYELASVDMGAIPYGKCSGI